MVGPGLLLPKVSDVSVSKSIKNGGSASFLYLKIVLPVYRVSVSLMK